MFKPLFCIALWCLSDHHAETVEVGDTFSKKVALDGIGEIALPQGEWVMEYVQTDWNEDRAYGIKSYVLKKKSGQLERITIRVFGRNMTQQIANYIDSTGDRMSKGIPMELIQNKTDHDTVEFLCPTHVIEKRESVPTCLGCSYVYTGDGVETWMSHALVCNRKGCVIVISHASPHAITPATVKSILKDSRLEI